MESRRNLGQIPLRTRAGKVEGFSFVLARERLSAHNQSKAMSPNAPRRPASPPDPKRRSYLRRLPPEAYQGRVAVHWSMTIHRRARGWLDETFHLQFRECLAHAAFLEGLAIPLYCLMPDHLHLLALGFRAESNQQAALAFLRRQVNRLLRARGEFELQRQAYDHVLDAEDESGVDGVQAVARYIQENPLRAGLVQDPAALTAYPFLGCLLPGYPDVSIWLADYWERFWRIYAHSETRFSS